MPCPGQSIPYTIFKRSAMEFLTNAWTFESRKSTEPFANYSYYDRKSCLVCANSQFKDPNASFHRFPSDPGRWAIWLRVFHLQEGDIKAHHCVCSRHFPNGNAKNDPTITLGKRFASPIKKGPRAKRAKVREAKKQLSELYSTVSPTPSSSRSVTPSTFEQPALTVAAGKQLQSAM